MHRTPKTSLRIATILACASALAAVSPARAASEPRFRMVVIGQLVDKDGKPEIHAPMVKAAEAWLKQLALDSNFAVTLLEAPSQMTDSMLAVTDVLWQLNYIPFYWGDPARALFQKYIDGGKLGYIGIHHAILYGPAVWPAGESLWPWYYNMIGKINYQNYIANFASGKVRVEQTGHPIFAGVPANFTVVKDEWYTYDKSPRPNVTVLANVDESSYVFNDPSESGIKMGDHPVIWTNPALKGRNIIMQIGHDTTLYKNDSYKAILRNAFFWLANKPAVAVAPEPGSAPAMEARLDIKVDERAIRFGAQGAHVISVTVYDASGHCLRREEGAGAIASIDRGEWAAGRYLVQAVTARGPVSQWVSLP